MAKLRSNHRKANTFAIARLLVLMPIGAVLLVLAIRQLDKYRLQRYGRPDPLTSMGTADEYLDLPADNDSARFYVPQGGKGIVIHHRQFSLSYVEKFELSEWVAYPLTRAQLNLPKFSRPDRFNPDYSIKTGSSMHRDYTGSGYTRGHLAPAADMAWDSLALRETFYMSNITPQLKFFNAGIWRELEEQTRDWARKFRRLYVVSGPVLSTITDRIGPSKVGVPKLYYKALLDLDEPEQKSIAFLIPNELSEKPLAEYAVAIDSVEILTGLNLFDALVDDRREEKLERSYDLNLWPFHPQRYQWRVDEWNRR